MRVQPLAKLSAAHHWQVRKVQECRHMNDSGGEESEEEETGEQELQLAQTSVQERSATRSQTVTGLDPDTESSIVTCDGQNEPTAKEQSLKRRHSSDDSSEPGAKRADETRENGS